MIPDVTRMDAKRDSTSLLGSGASVKVYIVYTYTPDKVYIAKFEILGCI